MLEGEWAEASGRLFSTQVLLPLQAEAEFLLRQPLSSAAALQQARDRVTSALTFERMLTQLAADQKVQPHGRPASDPASAPASDPASAPASDPASAPATSDPGSLLIFQSPYTFSGYTYYGYTN